MRSERTNTEYSPNAPGATATTGQRPVPHAPLIVVSGPSGVGKTTIVERLIRQTQLPLRRAITATTRERRPHETHAEDYFFWNDAEFALAVKTNKMLEHAVVFGKDSYGTPRSEVDDYREQGTGVVLVIDVQGAARVRELMPDDHLSVFIAPPSIAELESRLRGRGDTSEERIQRRLQTAIEELKHSENFDYRIVNNELTEAVRELETIVREHFPTQGESSCSTN
jgi:guanylate kinase